MRTAPLQWGLLALGLAGLCWLLAQVDLAVLWEQTRGLGPGGIAAVVVLGGLDQLFHALGWRVCFEAREAPAWRPLLSAHFAGNAVNLATPTAGVGGEFVRATLLSGAERNGRSAGTPAAVAALAVDRLGFSLADGGIGAAGVVVLMFSSAPGLSSSLRFALVAGTSLVILGIAIFGALQRQGRIARILVEREFLARWLGPVRAAQLRDAGSEIDQRVRRFHTERFPALLACIASHAIGSSMLIAQLGCLVSLLDLWPSTTVPGLLASFAVITALDLLAVFIPGRLGAQEGARMLGVAIAGLPAELGLLLSIAQRIEQGFWAVVGFGLYTRVLAARRPQASAS